MRIHKYSLFIYMFSYSNVTNFLSRSPRGHEHDVDHPGWCVGWRGADAAVSAALLSVGGMVVVVVVYVLDRLVRKILNCHNIFEFLKNLVS